MSHDGIESLVAGGGVFITGATGFVGKVVLEKVLRCVPSVKHVFLLIRPRKGCSAQQRLEVEILDSKIFDRLKRQVGVEGFRGLAQKLVAIAGDITHAGCGVSASDFEIMSLSVKVVFHCAASIDFDERIDRAMELNVHGPLRMLELAFKFPELKTFVHVSTCYVNSNRPGETIEEKIYPLAFDPEQVISQVAKMQVQDLEKVPFTGFLREWPNTYTFTKNLAEHVVHSRFRKGNPHFALAIVRPAIVAAAWKEPVPGWVDDISAATAFYAGVALGFVRLINMDPNRVLDLVPVDVVANVIINAAPAVLAHPQRFSVSHACSSTTNPLRFRYALGETLRHFKRNPASGAFNPGVTLIKNPQLYRMAFFLKYSVPLALLNFASLSGSKKLKQRASQFDRLVVKLQQLKQSFSFFIGNEFFFLSKNAEQCWRSNRSEQEKQVFFIDLQDLSWESYSKQYAYGIYVFCLGENLIESDPNKPLDTLLINSPRPARMPGFVEPWQISSPSPRQALGTIFPNVDLIVDRFLQLPQNQMSIPREALINMVMQSIRVQKAIKEIAVKNKVDSSEIAQEAQSIIDKMAGETNRYVISGMGLLLRKIFLILFQSVHLNPEGIDALRQVVKQGPLVYLPTHRSYLDFLIISFICFLYDLPIPYIAAGEDFLGIIVIRTLFRYSGAFFLRRSFSSDKLYSVILDEYFRILLKKGNSIEFFIEGTRSRSGKTLEPKLGLLKRVLETFLAGDVKEVTLCPIAINYEKTLEGWMYQNELLGGHKIKESLRSLMVSIPYWLKNLGRISIHFSPNTLSLSKFVSLRVHSSQTLTQLSQQELESILVSLGDHVIYEINQSVEIMCTHLVACLLLMYRQGITTQQLVDKVQWLREEVLKRKGRIAFMEMENPLFLVKESLSHLRAVVLESRPNVYEPAISSRQEFDNMLLLGHYRNKLLHVFFEESVLACALYSFGEEQMEKGVDKDKLFEEAGFLYSLLCREVISPPGYQFVRELHVSGEFM
jgi:glycerone phosphate O-acyltransferase/fatty acyl-CoA reductase